MLRSKPETAALRKARAMANGDEPERIFQQAVGFHQAQKILMESSPNDQREALVPPVCVLAAFTSELMLKCLICIERGSPPRGHDLLALFNELTAPTRKRLEVMWTDYVQHHPDRAAFKKAEVTMEPELTSALAAGRKGFEVIRYWHEEPDCRQVTDGVICTTVSEALP